MEHMKNAIVAKVYGIEILGLQLYLLKQFKKPLFSLADNSVYITQPLPDKNVILPVYAKLTKLDSLWPN